LRSQLALNTHGALSPAGGKIARFKNAFQPASIFREIDIDIRAPWATAAAMETSMQHSPTALLGEEVTRAGSFE
jgi:hypothetical protein